MTFNPQWLTLLFSFLGNVILGVSVYFLYKQIKTNHEWNRRKTSQELLNSLTLGEFPTELSRIRIKVKTKLGCDMQDRSKNYSHLKQCLSEEEIAEISTSIIKVINVLETIAINIKNSIVEEDICYNFSYTFFIDYYYWAKPYIYECRKREDNEFILAEYEYYALKWEKRLNEEKDKARTDKTKIVKAKKKL